jgi:hypothetical protein
LKSDVKSIKNFFQQLRAQDRDHTNSWLLVGRYLHVGNIPDGTAPHQNLPLESWLLFASFPPQQDEQESWLSVTQGVDLSDMHYENNVRHAACHKENTPSLDQQLCITNIGPEQIAVSASFQQRISLQKGKEKSFRLSNCGVRAHL